MANGCRETVWSKSDPQCFHLLTWNPYLIFEFKFPAAPDDVTLVIPLKSVKVQANQSLVGIKSRLHAKVGWERYFLGG